MGNRLHIIQIVPFASKISLMVSIILSLIITSAQGTYSGIIFNFEINLIYLFASFLAFIISYPVIFLFTYLIISLVNYFLLNKN